jgi:hypothetical protein
MNPTTLTQTARPKAGVTILSGMAVVLKWNATDSVYEWDLADRVDVLSAKRTVYIAYQDSTDMDVRDGGLTGLSSSGDFEIQTAFFDESGGKVYPVDTILTVGTVATAGYFTVAASTHPIVGKVTRNNAARQLQKFDPVNPKLSVKDDSSTLAANSKVIVFQTGFGPGVLVP